MTQIQIYHEAPLSIFDKVQAVTDGDYALVHLLDENEEYAERFVSIARYRNIPNLSGKPRPLILDNSAYELGESFDPEKFAEWVEILRPDYYVVPDVPGEAEATLIAFEEWGKKYKGLPGKRMGVLQGKTATEAVNCFRYLQQFGADIIGIPFLIGRGFGATDDINLMSARVLLYSQIYEQCTEHPIHLLGVSLPQEGKYASKMPWIVSVDTSNPIVAGMQGLVYGLNEIDHDGLDHKPSELMADLIEEHITPGQDEIIFENIASFRRLFKR